MKTILLNILLIGSIVSSVMLSSCKKDESPENPDPSQEKGKFTDSRDGNTYEWVKIGNQVWMSENLAYTGDGIQYITDDDEWASNTDYDGWCYYGNEESNGSVNGVLYQWEAAKTACPSGWHLPTKSEWIDLVNYLKANSYSYDGVIGNEGIAKSLATDTGWAVSDIQGAVGNSDFTEYRNKSGFSALPSGSRNITGGFYGLIIHGSWWSATESGNLNAYIVGLAHDKATAYYQVSYSRSYGYSVRCVKD